MPIRIEKKIAALEELPRLSGRVVEENDDVLILSSGPRLLEIPKRAIKDVKKGAEGMAELTLNKDAQVIQSILISPGRPREIISAELLGALRIDQVACNCNCNCNCDSGNCNCNCNCNRDGRALSPALLLNTRSFQSPLVQTAPTG